METYNFAHLSADSTSWISARFLVPILSLEGGWESWMQIDFPAWLDATAGKQFDFRREVPVLGPGVGGPRADWFINSQAPSAAHPLYWVEFKAQGHKYLNTKFKADVQIDLDTMAGTPVDNCLKIMLVAITDGALAKDPVFGRAAGYKLLYKNDEMELLYKQLA